MKRLAWSVLVAVAFAPAARAGAQEGVVSAGENLVVDGIPPIPASLAETAGRYAENRSAFPSDWHPQRRELLIGTRFGNTYQIHRVTMPGGARQQLTFFPEPVYGGSFHPNGADYILFSKDVGGGEWYQQFRYDLATGSSTMVTDGKSRNIPGPWSNRGDQEAYTSTRRTGQDTDLWIINPADPKTDHLLIQVSGGGWEPQDWSPDDKKILLLEGISVNESYVWCVDTATGEKTALTPRKTGGTSRVWQRTVQQGRKGRLLDHRPGLRVSAACLPRSREPADEDIDCGYSLGRGTIRFVA